MAINFPFKKSTAGLSALPDETHTYNDFSEAINLFKTQREKYGFSLEKLSTETKISKNVLISIENGWEKYLPETTYLTSMIKILEIKLNLERGSLNGLLLRKGNNDDITRFKFNFINIDFINSWIGSLLYFIFMLLSILALNSQQRYLIKINSISTEPIIIETSETKDRNIIYNKKEQ
jgi:DNA-binding XRE family transcriptional regulator